MPRYQKNHLKSRSLEVLSKPEWIRTKLPSGENYHRLKNDLRESNLNTVCEEANCPNLSECWAGGTATFMLLGDICSRACRFCNVRAGKLEGKVDESEAGRVADTVSKMKLQYVVLTSVDRDDLPDGGAEQFARTIEAIRTKDPGILVEALIPDFQNDIASLRKIVEASPTVIAHNIETTRSLTPTVRDPRAGYDQSMKVLRNSKMLDPAIYTKSSIMLGLGESYKDLLTTMLDLRNSNVDILTIGQYLRPSLSHLRVAKYIQPQRFDDLKSIGDKMGFLYTASGPLVRSSYRAGEFFVSKLVGKQSKAKAN